MISCETAIYICIGVAFVSGFMRLSIPAHWIGIFAYIMIAMIGFFKTSSIIFQILGIFFFYLKYLDLCRLQTAYELVNIEKDKDAKV